MRRVAAVVLLRSDGAALLNHRDDKPGLADADMWTFVGGNCEGDDESTDDCARREFHEETGILLSKLTPIAVIIDDRISPYELSVFCACYNGQEVHCYEGQENRFVRREDADNYRIPELLMPLWDKAIELSHQIKTERQSYDVR